MRTKYIYGAAAAFIVALIVWAISTAPETPTASDASQEPRVMSYEGNTLSEERDGRTIWTLTAEQVNFDIDTQDASMRGIVGTFYGKDGRTLELKADEGHMDHETRNVTLTGNVSAATSDGATLTADDLMWTAAAGELSATGEPQITRDDLRATGDVITSSDEFQQFRITGNARIEKGGETK